MSPESRPGGARQTPSSAPASPEEREEEELRLRWEKEFGPKLSPWRQRVSGLIVLAVFIGIMALVFATVSGR
ncbi:MAG: hypothetical protein EA406_02460 [Rhodospirillales bacterium]|nr:MAG: hypothetical protein EA406_02460 [Rhodospirillales bacterium]